jgi:hypothetical protein
MWVADKKADIAYCKENESSIDVDFKAMWSEYEKQMEAPVTRVEIADVTAAFLATWVSNSYSISPLSAASALIPSSYYTSFTNQVSTYANPQYSTYAFVLYKNSYLEYTKGPLLNTTWHQGTHDNPTYNSLIPNQPVAGCVNIALAQIMYYHQYPSTYSWNAMLPNASTPAAQTLISNLYTATGGNGSATFNQAKNALSTFGYTYTEQNHTGLTTYICQSLNNNRPVFMTGFDSNGAGGHAWVCSGYKSTSTTREFYFAFVPNGPIQYDTFGPYSTTNTVHYFYHLWGWANTIVNGWFIEDHVNTTIDGESYNPTVDRKDLINITHN